MTLYNLYQQEGEKLVQIATVDAGSPEDAGTRFVRQKYADATPPAEEKFVVIVDSAVTKVTVRSKTNVSFEVASDREVRRRAQERPETPAEKSQAAHDKTETEGTEDPKNDVPQRDAVNA